MFTIGDYIYEIKNNLVTKINIFKSHNKDKFCNQQKIIPQIFNNVVCIHYGDYLWVFNDKGLVGKIFESGINYITYSHFWNWTTSAVDDFVILQIQYESINWRAIVYDFATNNIRKVSFSMRQFRQIIISPDGTYIVIVRPNRIIICDSVESCILKLERSWFYIADEIDIKVCDWILWRNNYDFIGFNYAGNICSEIVLYRGFEIDRTIGIYLHKVAFNKNQIIVRNEVVYVWDDKKMLILDRNNCVSCLNNLTSKLIYNYKHNVFIDDNCRFFRVEDGLMTSCVLRFDFWADSDVPDHIRIVVIVLIELYLFPNEICNEIYKQMT